MEFQIQSHRPASPVLNGDLGQSHWVNRQHMKCRQSCQTFKYLGYRLRNGSIIERT
jgi:hypothetical protein